MRGTARPATGPRAAPSKAAQRSRTTEYWVLRTAYWKECSMNLRRLFLAVALLLAVVGVAYVGQANEPAGVKMANAAQKFLDGLDKEKRDKATLAFADK